MVETQFEMQTHATWNGWKYIENYKSWDAFHKKGVENLEYKKKIIQTLKIFLRQGPDFKNNFKKLFKKLFWNFFKIFVSFPLLKMTIKVSHSNVGHCYLNSIHFSL